MIHIAGSKCNLQILDPFSLRTYTTSTGYYTKIITT